jgi:hypothetical protein
VATRQVGALVINPAEHSVTIDISRLEAPDKLYDADIAWIEHVPGAVSLMFAKLNRDDRSHLKSRLEVRYAPEALLLTFWSNSRAFFATTKAYVARWPAETRRPIDPPAELPALQSHSEWSSFTYMSHAGSEAAIDFYHVAPGALAQIIRGQQVTGLRVLPVVRVQLSTFELMRFVERVQPLISVIRDYIPASHSQAKEVPDSFGEDEETAAAARREYGS